MHSTRAASWFSCRLIGYQIEKVTRNWFSMVLWIWELELSLFYYRCLRQPPLLRLHGYIVNRRKIRVLIFPSLGNKRTYQISIISKYTEFIDTNDLMFHNNYGTQVHIEYGSPLAEYLWRKVLLHCYERLLLLHKPFNPHKLKLLLTRNSS